MNLTEVEEKVRKGLFPPSALKIARQVEEKEDRFWEKYDARVDNNTGHDDQ